MPSHCPGVGKLPGRPPWVPALVSRMAIAHHTVRGSLEPGEKAKPIEAGSFRASDLETTRKVFAALRPTRRGALDSLKVKAAGVPFCPEEAWEARSGHGAQRAGRGGGSIDGTEQHSQHGSIAETGASVIGDASWALAALQSDDALEPLRHDIGGFLTAQLGELA